MSKSYCNRIWALVAIFNDPFERNVLTYLEKKEKREREKKREDAAEARRNVGSSSSCVFFSFVFGARVLTRGAHLITDSV